MLNGCAKRVPRKLHECRPVTNVSGIGSVEGASIVDGVVPQPGRPAAIWTAPGQASRSPRGAIDQPAREPRGLARRCPER